MRGVAKLLVLAMIFLGEPPQDHHDPPPPPPPAPDRAVSIPRATTPSEADAWPLHLGEKVCGTPHVSVDLIQRRKKERLPWIYDVGCPKGVVRAAVVMSAN